MCLRFVERKKLVSPKSKLKSLRYDYLMKLINSNKSHATFLTPNQILNCGRVSEGSCYLVAGYKYTDILIDTLQVRFSARDSLMRLFTLIVRALHRQA